MDFNEYETLPLRIKQIFNTCSKDEQQYLLKILEELSILGYSPTYDTLWLQDYIEIPVDKETFLTNDEFLGLTNNHGKAIYPVWMDTMKELERSGNQYSEVVFTGATRTGKTSTAVSETAYQLYRIMCLRDPQQFFGLKSISRISIFFFNITQTLAKGVAFKEFNSTLAASPWFNKHGHFTKSESNPIYVPDGNLIEITYGSDASHALGKATYCLTGNTEIYTKDGIRKLEFLDGNFVEVFQYDIESEDIMLSNAYVSYVKSVDETIRLTLEDGSVIEGTPNHKIMLTDGTYKELKDISEEDDIMVIGGLDEQQIL